MIRRNSIVLAKFFPILFALFCFGCQNDVRPAVDMATCKIQPGREPIVIDGRSDPNGHEWDGAASVPISSDDGKAKFLWDDKGVYGYLFSKRLPPLGPDESICVSMVWSYLVPDEPTGNIFINPGDGPKIHLYVTSNFNSKGDDEISGRFTGIEPRDLPQAKFAAHMEIAQMNFPWQAEFFVPWQLLTRIDNAHPPHIAGTLVIHVYRIQGERPYSYLKLKLPGK